MKYLLVILFLLAIQNISSLCSDPQIDINSASIKELEELIGIGPVKAKAIINSRPYDSIDDLINVNGIGKISLEKIKEQGLACVNGVNKQKEVAKKPEIQTIKLNAKTFKSSESTKIQEPDKNNYAIYGFVGFFVLLGFLFAIKKIKYRKNEFN